MIKEYRKVSTIKAEQFDGTLGIVAKYDIKFNNADSTLNEYRPIKYYLDTLEGTMKLFTGDWIATGSNGEHWAIRDNIFRKNYQEVEK